MEALTEEVVEPRQSPLSRRRGAVLVACAAASLVVVAALWLGLAQERASLDTLDRWGRHAEDWADDHDALVVVLRVVEVAFATVGTIIWTSLLVLALASRRRYRAVVFVIAVMMLTSLATTGLKLWLRRERPTWQDTVDSLTTHSFPSGHASSTTALAGILLFLAWSLLRGRRLRRWVTFVAVVAWVAVILDRVLLGRHYPTDVLAGTFLGLAVLLLGIVVTDPARLRPRGS